MDRHKKEHKFQNKRCYKNLQYNCFVYFFLVSFFVLYYVLFLLGAVGPICILGTPISKVSSIRIGVPKIQKKYHYTVQKLEFCSCTNCLVKCFKICLNFGIWNSENNDIFFILWNFGSRASTSKTITLDKVEVSLSFYKTGSAATIFCYVYNYLSFIHT